MIQPRENPSAFNAALQSIQPMVNRVSDGISAATNAISDSVERIQKGVSDILPKAPSLNTAQPLSTNLPNSNGSGSIMESVFGKTKSESNSTSYSDFFSLNSIFAKIAFFIFVIILFLILAKLTLSAMLYSFQSKSNPVLINGLISGVTPYTLIRNPNNQTFVSLPRSNNQYYGSEFTWSVWLNVDQLESKSYKYYHVFNLGNKTPRDNGIMSVNNSPGVYLMQSKSNTAQTGYSLGMHIVMDTEPFSEFDAQKDISNNVLPTLNVNSKSSWSHSKYIDITELPLKNWFNVVIRLENTVLDIYINGTIAGRINFETVPKQNFYDVQVCQNGGFQGLLSDLKYFSRALNIFEINSVVLAGPNLASPTIQGSVDVPSGGKLNSYDYISDLWYYRNT